MEVGKQDLLNTGRRDKIEIISAIIALTREPAYVWYISRQSGLSHPQMKTYLKFMTETGLIKKNAVTRKGEKKAYSCQATEKGLKLLKLYCDSLVLLYGEEVLMKRNPNLAVACLQLCKERGTATISQTQKRNF